MLTSNEYDHVGRLITAKHKVNNQTEVILARNEYNEIGQLKNKKQHSENNGTNFLNTTSYAYNERGWTTEASSTNFSYVLNYHNHSKTKAVIANAQYNGNISQQLWGHASTTPNTFSYTYPPLIVLQQE